MPGLMTADTIRILVATDNHVGYNERDPVRGDDSWRSFHEVMCLAKERDVDMVLLAGDLFHENKPSRKSMYQVMRSLRMNCYGDKPCELEMLSDASENFQGAFNHVNYEDQDINVAIPVFSIHGNHDDPSGEGHLAALDLLQMSGLLNYYGRTPESDNIQIKPVLLQKGHTKLALYGMSNVRDERLFRTFRDGKVKFFQPNTQKDDWFNIMSVHQNHHAYTETSYLPENFLPEFLDLVIWGHEHECLIDPRTNPETNFKVMQPGSSVATSLALGEAVPKHVAVVSVMGRDFTTENIRLKTVRPFVMKEIVLSEEKEAQRFAKKDNNRTELTRLLMKLVEQLIEQAKAEWLEAQEGGQEDDEEATEVPLPLIRLRVEISAPDGGSFDCENPQRFSNRFVGKVANINDVVQFHRKKKNTTTRRTRDEVADEAVMSHLQGLDTVAVEKLVREYLATQSLTILPQNYFGDAVSQYIDKDDKHAMEMFVNESLANQIKHLLDLDRDDADEDEEEEEHLAEAMEKYRSQLEEMFAKGQIKRSQNGKNRFKPRPDGWDSEFDGAWEDQPGALLRPDEDDGANGAEEEDEDDGATPKPVAIRGRGRGRGRGARGATIASTRKPTSSTTKSAPPSRSRRKVVEDDEDEDADSVMLGAEEGVDDEEEDSQPMFFKEKPTRGRRTAAPTTHKSTARGKKSASPVKKPPPRSAAASARQSKISFTGSQASVLGRGGRRSQSAVSDDVEDDDDDDAFEPVAKTRARR
jgi:double-strand break repair protein MRE11